MALNNAINRVFTNRFSDQIDLKELNKKADAQKQYRQQLQIQKQDMQKRKNEQKRKEIQENRKYEIEFYKNRNIQLNNKNIVQKSFEYINKQQLNDTLKETLKSQTGMIVNEVQNYQKDHHNLDNSNITDKYDEQRQRKYKDQLDLKIQQIYHEIERSKQALKIKQQLQQIKNKINFKEYLNKNNNDSFIGGVSKFYAIPTLSNRGRNKRQFDHKKEKRSYGVNQSQVQSMYLKQEKDEIKKNILWGKQTKDNYLSNRQALDYKINNIMDNIDNILEKKENLKQRL